MVARQGVSEKLSGLSLSPNSSMNGSEMDSLMGEGVVWVILGRGASWSLAFSTLWYVPIMLVRISQWIIKGSPVFLHKWVEQRREGKEKEMSKCNLDHKILPPILSYVFLWASLIKLLPGLSRVSSLCLTLYFQEKQTVALVQEQEEEWTWLMKEQELLRHLINAVTPFTDFLYWSLETLEFLTIYFGLFSK